MRKKLFLPVAALVLSAAAGAAETAFLIDFNAGREIQIIEDRPEITVSGVRAESADGMGERILFGQNPAIFGDRDFIHSPEGWKNENPRTGKSYLFTIEVDAAYRTFWLTQLRFLLFRPEGSERARWTISVDRELHSDGELPPGSEIEIVQDLPEFSSRDAMTIRLTIADPGFDGDVYLGGIRGTGGLTSTPVAADSTINEENRYAYSANTGWINLRAGDEHGVTTGEYFLSGYGWNANLGWINFGLGAPVNGWRYANDSATDFGVNVDGFGDLSGYAWGANFGWINFGWAEADDPDRPRIDMRSGEFSGYAWGANIGWINLGTGDLATDSFALLDSDGDGMADAWKYRYFGDTTTAGPGTDFSGDGYTDLEHYLAGSDPTKPGAPLAIVDFELYERDEDEAARLQFTSSPRRLYRIEASDDLQSWGDHYALGLIEPGDGDTTRQDFIIPEESPRQFFRVRATHPLHADDL